jgi:hypothetical protein
MKAYLEGATIFKEERNKSKCKKDMQKYKEAACYVGKIRLAAEGVQEIASDHRRKNHQRVRTELLDRKGQKV